MNYFIIGATGMLGSTLTRYLLEKGSKVFPIKRQDFDISKNYKEIP